MKQNIAKLWNNPSIWICALDFFLIRSMKKNEKTFLPRLFCKLCNYENVAVIKWKKINKAMLWRMKTTNKRKDVFMRPGLIMVKRTWLNHQETESNLRSTLTAKGGNNRWPINLSPTLECICLRVTARVFVYMCVCVCVCVYMFCECVRNVSSRFNSPENRWRSLDTSW